jgi:hypothetical protein
MTPKQLTEPTTITFRGNRGLRVALVLAAGAKDGGGTNVSDFIRDALHAAIGRPTIDALTRRHRLTGLRDKAVALGDSAETVDLLDGMIAEADLVIATWKDAVSVVPSIAAVVAAYRE